MTGMSLKCVTQLDALYGARAPRAAAEVVTSLGCARAVP